MNSYSIELRQETLTELLTRSTRAASALSSELEKDHQDEMAGILEHFCRDDRGTVGSGSISVCPEEVEFREGSLVSISFDFIETAHYGCADADVWDHRQINLEFVVDLCAGKILLDSPEFLLAEEWHTS